MSLLVFILVTLIVLALTLWGIQQLPLDNTLLRITQAVAIFVAALAIASRAGML